MKKFLVYLCLFLVLLLAIGIWGAWKKDDERNAELASTSDPTRFAQLMISEEAAHTTASLQGNTLQVSFDLAPWSLTTGTTSATFNMKAAFLVPAVFDKFPNISAIDIVGLGEFTDIRGNKSTAPYMHVQFTRANSSTIVWKDIRWANLPQLADKVWAHPAYYKE
jgi:hypothetical protein